MRESRLFIPLIAILIVTTACAAPTATVPRSSSADPSAPRAEKRIVYATTINTDIRPTAERGSRQSVLPFVASGLTTSDGQGGRRPLLAEAVPTIENGLWQVNPDGTMVTTFTVRPSAQWHNGAPVTADDFLFSLDVGRDRAMPAFGIPAYASIADASAPDPRTFVVRWKEPYVEAETLFSWDKGYGPLPRQLLGDAYTTSKEGFLDLPYWGVDYVGAGPFKIASWDPGVGMRLIAHEGYALGRPKLDRIDVQVIVDTNTLVANLLSATVDAVPNVQSLETAIQLRGQWTGGSILVNTNGGTWTVLVPQFIDPNPAAIADIRLRRALVTGIDRQAIVEEILGGFSPIPLSFLSPNQPQYAAIEATLPRYDYDPALAARLLAEMVYTRGSDGTFRDATGQALAVEVRSGPTGGEQQARAAATVAADWQRLGVQATPYRVPPQMANLLQERATFPGFWVKTQITDTNSMRGFTSTATPLPSNDYGVGAPRNDSRYMSDELDSLVTAYFRTIPVDERLQIVSRVATITTTQITHLGLYYDASTAVHSSRMLGVSSRWDSPTFPWNAYEWDVQ